MNQTKNQYYAIVGILILAISVAVRLAAYPIIVSDYTYFTAKWFDALHTHAWLTAFTTPFSDYAPLYLYVLKLLTFIPLPSLYSIKTLSFLFDVFIASVAYVMIKKTSPVPYTKSQLFFAFVVMVSIPTVLINSSLWGQADALYAAGVVLSLYCILVEAPLWAAIALGVALSLKIQAIFFLPVLVGYFLRDKRTVWYVLVLPGIYLLSLVPALLGGGSFWYLLTVYVHEANEYTWLNVSSQSIFSFINNLPISTGFQDVLFWLGILLAGVGAAWIIACIAYPSEKPSPLKMVYLSLMCVILVPFLLPRMHERYFYLADLLSVVYAFYNPRQWYVPVLVVLSSFLAYMPFLSSQVSWFSAFHIDLRVPSTILFVALVLLLFSIKERQYE